MNVLFALPGLHRYDRGAEVALLSIASEMAKKGDKVTLIGSGTERVTEPYQFLQAKSVRRERFERYPSFPLFRNEYAFEEFTFIPGLLWKYRPSEYDVTITCSYPFTNWILRRPRLRGYRPPHVYITENGDWPARAQNSEYRLFGCEGLVCTNPDYYERNKDRWNCRLIPNGVDNDRFVPLTGIRNDFSLPHGKLIVLMVSALIQTKRVDVGIEAVSKIPGAHLVVAGDGPFREQIDDAASRLLPGRFTRLTVAADRMPALYQCADVFLHLSKEESFGNVFLEAMATGLPIVGHDSERLRWIVGNDEYLLDTGDTSAIASRIREASNEPAQRRTARAVKAGAFSWSKIAEMYQKFLIEVVDLASKNRQADSI